jgi:hypothetical protein
VSLEKVADLRKLVEQAQSLKAKAEAAVEHAQVAESEALSKLKALGVGSAEQGLEEAEKARAQVQTAMSKIEAKLKEAINRE